MQTQLRAKENSAAVPQDARNAPVIAAAASVAIGKIVRPQGRHGALRLYPSVEVSVLTGSPALRQVTLIHPDGAAEERGVLSLKPYKVFVIMQLADCQNMDEAERLAGAEVRAARAALAPLPQNDFFWEDLVAARIETASGPLGVLRDFFSTGSNDVWVVETPQGELLLPATDEVIEHVDLERRRIVVRPLDGLLDACLHVRHAH